MIDDRRDARRHDDDGAREPRADAPGWGIPLAFGALMLIAGALVFSAADPDRTRTAEYNNLNSKPSASAPSTDMRGPAAKAPNPDMPTAPRSQSLLAEESLNFAPPMRGAFFCDVCGGIRSARDEDLTALCGRMTLYVF